MQSQKGKAMWGSWHLSQAVLCLCSHSKRERQSKHLQLSCQKMFQVSPGAAEKDYTKIWIISPTFQSLVLSFPAHSLNWPQSIILDSTWLPLGQGLFISGDPCSVPSTVPFPWQVHQKLCLCIFEWMNKLKSLGSGVESKRRRMEERKKRKEGRKKAKKKEN